MLESFCTYFVIVACGGAHQVVVSLPGLELTLAWTFATAFSEALEPAFVAGL
jgi:hypothetical protein